MSLSRWEIVAVLVAALAITRRWPLSLFATIAASMLAAGVFAVGGELLLEHHLSGRWCCSCSP